MLSKHFAILALLAGLPAFAQEPAATVSPSTTAILMHHNRPMRLYGVPTPSTVKSPDWGGYAVTGTGFTKALGSWIVPTLDCTKTPYAFSAYWVGMDGYSSSTIEQIGTEADCNSTASYYAWYAFYPDPPQMLSTIKVSAGDRMSATVSYSGSQFKLQMTNHTTGKTSSVTGASNFASRTSAEWIVYGASDLADFTSVSFGDDYTRVHDTNWAVNSTVTGPISDFGTKVKKIILVDDIGEVKAAPSALTTDGSSFKVTWKAELAKKIRSPN